jgi:DNA-binding NtrC family response regulator
MLTESDIRAAIGTFTPVEHTAAPTLKPSKQETFAQARERFDRQVIQAALDQCAGKVPEAAASLGLGRSTLYKKMVALGMA